MPRLFISYAREDQQWVEAFSQALIAAGFEVWRDNAIPTGEPFGRVIERAIEDANAVVVVWSKDAVESDWVRAEATEGLRRDILIPVQRDASVPPLRFRTLQTTNLADWQFDAGYPDFDGLVRELHQRMDAGGSGAGRAGSGKEGGFQDSTGGHSSRRIWLLAVAALLLVGSAALFWYLGQARSERQLALELTAAAQSEREQITAESRVSGKYWYYYLSQSGGQTRVERAVLLALEAARRHRSPQTLEALGKSLLLLQRPRLQWRLGSTISRVSIFTDLHRLAWTNRDGLWVNDLQTGSAARQLDTDGLTRALIALDPKDYLLAVGNGGGVKLWNPGDGRQLWRLADSDDRTLDFAVSDDSMTLALKLPGSVKIIDLPTGRAVQQVETESTRRLRTGRSVDLSADGRYLAVAVEKQLLIQDLNARKALHKRQYSSRLTALAFDPADDGLVVATSDGRVQKISLPFGDSRELASGTPVNALHFSPGGDRLALAGSNRVSVLAVENPHTRLLEYRHADRVTSVIFSDDGARIASAGQDGDVRVFDIATQRALARLSHPDQLLGIRFSTDARSLLTVGRIGSVAEWPIDYAEPLQEACRRLARNLSPEEWQRYLPGVAYRSSCPPQTQGDG